VVQEKKGTYARLKKKKSDPPNTREDKENREEEEGERLHDGTLLPIVLAVLVNPGHELVVLLLRLDLIREPPFEKGSEFGIKIVCGTWTLADIPRSTLSTSSSQEYTYQHRPSSPCSAGKAGTYPASLSA